MNTIPPLPHVERPPDSPEAINFLNNPLYLLLGTATMVFIAELSIMSLLKYLPHLPEPLLALLDATSQLVIVFPTLYFFAFRPLRLHIAQRQRAEEDKDQLIVQLRRALAEVKTLQGIIPICANCKNIRDDQGYWHKVEAYVSSRSDAFFSHSICPTCIKKYYPEYVEERTDTPANASRPQEGRDNAPTAPNNPEQEDKT